MSMEKKEKALFELSLGETGIVSDITSDIGIRRRFMDIGCMVGSDIKKLGVGPFGDPSAYLICGAVIAIRKKDAATIRVVASESQNS